MERWPALWQAIFSCSSNAGKLSAQLGAALLASYFVWCSGSGNLHRVKLLMPEAAMLASAQLEAVMLAGFRVVLVRVSDERMIETR